jgi:excisionase family DNA binding protein
MDNRALLTVPEAAHRLSLGRATAYRLVQQGELPSVRIGRALRVPTEALNAWVRALMGETTDRSPSAGVMGDNAGPAVGRRQPPPRDHRARDRVRPPRR